MNQPLALGDPLTQRLPPGAKGEPRGRLEASVGIMRLALDRGGVDWSGVTDVTSRAIGEMVGVSRNSRNPNRDIGYFVVKPFSATAMGQGDPELRSSKLSVHVSKRVAFNVTARDEVAVAAPGSAQRSVAEVRRHPFNVAFAALSARVAASWIQALARLRLAEPA